MTNRKKIQMQWLVVRPLCLLLIIFIYVALKGDWLAFVDTIYSLLNN